MWFTKNEKAVLKMLLENSRVSDKVMSQKLGISSQAVGRIRKQLEESIIKKYSIELDLNKLGITLFETRGFRILNNKIPSGIHKIEEEIIKVPNCYFLARTTEGYNTYFFCGGFEDMNEFQKVVKENKLIQNNFLELQKPIFFSTSDILKLSYEDLILKIINKTKNKN